MDKESMLKMAQVLEDAEGALVSVTSERDALAIKCAAYEQRAEATKVATMLHDKGIDTDIELTELVTRLEKEAAAGRLPEIARAADMIGPNMSFGKTHNNDGVEGQGMDVLTSYLMGSVS